MMRQLALLVLSLLLVLLPAAFGLPDEAVGHVVSVISGDSLGIKMLIADARTNNIDSIMLANIEAPSTVTAEGKAAQKYALSLLKNKTVYLDINDSEYGPVWPPVNRILVDGGYARLIETENCEFSSSAWWQPPPVFPPGEKRDRLLAMLEGRSQPEQLAFVGLSSSPTGVTMGSSKKGNVLEKDSA